MGSESVGHGRSAGAEQHVIRKIRDAGGRPVGIETTRVGWMLRVSAERRAGSWTARRAGGNVSRSVTRFVASRQMGSGPWRCGRARPEHT